MGQESVVPSGNEGVEGAAVEAMRRTSPRILLPPPSGAHWLWPLLPMPRRPMRPIQILPHHWSEHCPGRAVPPTTSHEVFVAVAAVVGVVVLLLLFFRSHLHRRSGQERRLSLFLPRKVVVVAAAVSTAAIVAWATAGEAPEGVVVARHCCCGW